MYCKSQECEDKCVCGLVIFLLFYYCAYLIYGLVSLIGDFNLWHDCYLECKNKLWIYCLMSFLMGFDKVYIRKKIVIEYGLVILSMILVIEMMLFSWGIIELFTKTICLENSCEDIFRSNLWAFAHLCFIMQLVFMMIYSGLIVSKWMHPSQRFIASELTAIDML